MYNLQLDQITARPSLSSSHTMRMLHDKNDVLLLDVLQEVMNPGNEDMWGSWEIEQMYIAKIDLET